MAIQRRRFLQVAGAGVALGLAGCTSGGDGGPDETETRADAERASAQVGDGELVLATTTSTDDTGLLDELNPVFEEEFGATVKTVPKGTGASLRTARDGDADVVLVHAREAEDAFLREGYGLNRRDVMFNDFVLVGPEDDPAGIGGADEATTAFATVADEEATFLSRGDDSGTNKKERAVWAAAGVEPGGTWYQEIGKGMGDTLVQASQVGGYTIADRGTYLSMRERVDLVVHVQGPLKGGSTILRNPYGVIPVNPAVHDAVNYELAMAYVGFLTGPRGQALIDGYTANGSQLFFPNALTEDPNFDEYVPADWSAEEAANASAEELRFRHWVETRVPADY